MKSVSMSEHTALRPGAKLRPLHALVIEHDQSDVELCLRHLRETGFDVRADVVQSPSELAERLRSKAYDVVLADYRMPGWTGMDALELIKQERKGVPFILVSGTLGEETAVECIKRGATDYVLKERLERLPFAVTRALEEVRLREDRKKAEEALQQSEKLLRLLLDSTAEGIFGADANGRCIFCNRAALDFLGYGDSEALLGKDLHEVCHHTRPDGRPYPHEECPIYQSLRQGTGVHAEDEIFWRADGTSFAVEYWSFPIRDRGENIGAVVTFVDITERKQIEERICRLAQAVENSAELIAMGDSEGRFTFANQSFLRTLGFSEDEIMGKPLRSTVLSPNDRPGLDEEIRLGVLEEGSWRGECLHRRKDGTDFPVYLSVGQVKDRKGCVIGSLGIAQDITERKQAEERFYKAFNANPEPITIATLSEGRYVDVNESFLRVTGYQREEVIGRTSQELKFWERPEDRERLVETLRQQGSVRDMEITFLTKSGERRTGLDSVAVIEVAGQPCIIAFFQDITERKRLEEQFRAAQKMEAVGQLAGGVAHDFNNLLGVIIGYSDLLLDRFPSDDPQHQQLQEIKKAGGRAASLTRQLLAFSRKQVFQPKVVDLNALVADLSKMLHRLIGEHIELVTTLKPGLGQVKADPGQFEQVIVNLVVNARDAMPEGGKLNITTANATLDQAYCHSHGASIQPGRYVVLSVADTGIGMDAQTQTHIFEPFFTTKEQGKGTGLGLATVYGVVKQSGGYIWVYSEVGKGTTFKIYLPRVDEPVEPLGVEHGKTELLQGSETILLAEDAESLRKLTCTFLQNNGYTVLPATNAAEAIEMAAGTHDGPIDLLLTDVVMPGMSGRELADHLAITRPEMRVLYMSGYTDDAIVHRGVLEPGTLFIEKPFSQEALLRKVREALDQAVKPQL